MNRKSLEAVFDRLLALHGFTKRGAGWYRQLDEVLQVIDVQKSSYSGQFFVNICLVPKGMTVEGMPTPKEHRCPIRARFGALFPDVSDQIATLLDLDKPLDESKRSTDIEALIVKTILPFLSELRTPDAVKSVISRGAFVRGAVTLAAMEHLGIRR